MNLACTLSENRFGRWILRNAEGGYLAWGDWLAWSGSGWALVDADGFPASDVQISNFETREEALAYANLNGLIVVQEDENADRAK